MEREKILPNHELHAEVPVEDGRKAVLCKSTLPGEKEPWVVWLMSAPGDRGSGSYHSDFESAWHALSGYVNQ